MLGDKVRCKITGFEGIVTSVSQQLTGCNRVFVEAPAVVHEGKVHTPGMWVDIHAVETVEKNAAGITRNEAPEGG